MGGSSKFDRLRRIDAEGDDVPIAYKKLKSDDVASGSQLFDFKPYSARDQSTTSSGGASDARQGFWMVKVTRSPP